MCDDMASTSVITGITKTSKHNIAHSTDPGPPTFGGLASLLESRLNSDVLRRAVFRLADDIHLKGVSCCYQMGNLGPGMKSKGFVTKPCLLQCSGKF